jgi:hypothetical protein
LLHSAVFVARAALDAATAYRNAGSLFGPTPPPSTAGTMLGLVVITFLIYGANIIADLLAYIVGIFNVTGSSPYAYPLSHGVGSLGAFGAYRGMFCLSSGLYSL